MRGSEALPFTASDLRLRMTVEGAYVIAAGKTGGHIFPGIALAREIRARRPEAPVLFVGTAEGLEGRLVPEAGFPARAGHGFRFRRQEPRRQAPVARPPAGRVPRGAGPCSRAIGRARSPAWAATSACRCSPRRARSASRRSSTSPTRCPGSPTGSSTVSPRARPSASPRSNAHLARPGIVTGTPVRRRVLRDPAGVRLRADAAPARLRRKPGLARS